MQRMHACVSAHVDFNCFFICFHGNEWVLHILTGSVVVKGCFKHKIRESNTQ